MDRQKDRWIDRKTDIQIERQIDRYKYRQIDKDTMAKKGENKVDGRYKTIRVC